MAGTDYGTVVAWLNAKLGVPPSRLADAFGGTAGAMRTSLSRLRKAPVKPVPRLAQVLIEQHSRPGELLTRPPVEIQALLGIVPSDRFVGDTRLNKAFLEGLESRVAEIVQKHRSEYRFVEGISQLRKLASELGHSGDPRLIEFLADIRFHIAWFSVHSGLCSSAISEAQKAVALTREAGQRSKGDKVNFARIAECFLISSLAFQLRSEPAESLKMLTLVSTAYHHAGVAAGSEYHRQLGVASLQLFNRDDEAAREFRAAMEAMRKQGNAPATAIEMAGNRQINLLYDIPNFDAADELYQAAETIFPSGTLEYCMNGHWAVACGCCTDSGNVHLRAEEIMKEVEVSVPHFGHQATIHTLLSITPRLRLLGEPQRRWVRRLMYESVYRND